MLKLDRVFGAIAMTGVVATTLQAQSPTLTFREAVSEALTRNDRMLSQADSTAQAEFDLTLARSTFRPKIVPNVFGSFGQSDLASQHYSIDLTQRFTTGTEMRLGLGTSTAQIPAFDGSGDVRFYNADTTLSLSQPLLRGFGTTVARRALTSAEMRRRAVDRQRDIVRRQVIVDTAAAYYQLLAQEAFVVVARASVARGERLQEAADAKLAAGLVSQLDVLRAKQLNVGAENQLADALSALDDARDALLLVMGRGPGEALSLDGQIPRITTDLDVDEAVAKALTLRPELKNLDDAISDAAARIAVSRNQQLPQVDLNVAMTRRQTAPGFLDSFGFDRYRLATFFTVGMPGDRTTQNIEYQQALLERQRRERDRAAVTRQIASEVRRQARVHDRLMRTVVAAETAVELSRQEVEVAQLRYDRGLSNNLDLVAAEGQLLAAESRRINALAQAAVQQLQLEASIGTLDPSGAFADAPRQLLPSSRQ